MSKSIVAIGGFGTPFTTNVQGYSTTDLHEENTMNKNNLLVRYDKDLRLRIMYPEARREITDNVVRFVRKAPGMNFVSFTFANESKLHQVIHQEVDYFLPLDQPFTWKVYDHDLLPSLKD